MRWVCDMQMTNYEDDGYEDQRATFDVAIASMQGGVVAFNMYHVARRLPRGVGAGVWRMGLDREYEGSELPIDGAYFVDGHYAVVGGSTIAYVAADTDRYSDSIHMTGLWPSATVFRPGDLFGLGGNLYMVKEVCVSDADGECTVPFIWKLWKPALAGDQIILQDPTARFVLQSKETGTQTLNGLFGSASIQAIEVPYVE